MHRALISRLREGSRPLFAAWVGSPEPLVAEACARCSFEAVVVDLQHGQVPPEAVTRMAFPLAALEKPLVVRIPVGAYEMASRLLDAGAGAVIAPMINSAADAAALVAATKYTPLGRRSWGPTRALDVFRVGAADYLAGANGNLLALAMIETREALAALDEILAVPGIDGVFVGPYDLTLTLFGGRGMDVGNPETTAALDHIVSRAHAARKISAIYAADGEKARIYAAAGYRLVAVGSEGGYLRAGAELMLAAARGGA
jgi:2,4-dihydroxyhept-2-ene-1,7-dioic acid aldolase